MRADCHCDTALFLLETDSLRELKQAHQDLRRLNRWLDLCFMGIFIDEKENGEDTPAMFRKVLQLLKSDMTANSDLVKPLLWREQLADKDSRSLLLISAEGAAGLGRNARFLDDYYNCGLRAVGLTWNYANEYAGGCGSDEGLSESGRELIRRCEDMGMLVDCAHLNRSSFWQVMEIAQKPLIVSHTCCDALQHHRRNLTDRQMLAVAEHGGVIGIGFVPDFLGGAGNLCRLCEHIEYSVALVGSEHVALGSDFDGCSPDPELAGIEKLDDVFRQLALRGMKDHDLANIMGDSVAALLKHILPCRPCADQTGKRG